MACSYDTLDDAQRKKLDELLTTGTMAPVVAELLDLPGQSARRMLLRMSKRGEAVRRRAEKGRGKTGRGRPPWLYYWPKSGLKDGAGDRRDGEPTVASGFDVGRD